MQLRDHQSRERQRGSSEGYTLILVVVVAGIYAAVMGIQGWIKSTKDERVEAAAEFNADMARKKKKSDTRGVWD